MLRKALAAGFAALWILSAFHTVDFGVWILENVLTVLAVGWVWTTRKVLPLSNASYVLIVLFLLAHEVGAHYTYEKVPIGIWLRPFFGLVRNDYDRIVHFCFGLLLTLPCYELMRRSLDGPRWLVLMTPMMVITGFSAFYEVAEAYA